MITKEEAKQIIRRYGYRDDILDAFLKRYDLTKVDFQAESRRIAAKQSWLSRSRREAFMEAIVLRDALNEIRQEEASRQEKEENADFSTT